MAIAEALGKFAWEVEGLTLDEYKRWVAYFEIRRKEQDKADKQSRRSAGGGGRSPRRPPRRRGR